MIKPLTYLMLDLLGHIQEETAAGHKPLMEDIDRTILNALGRRRLVRTVPDNKPLIPGGPPRTVGVMVLEERAKPLAEIGVRMRAAEDALGRERCLTEANELAKGIE